MSVDAVSCSVLLAKTIVCKLWLHLSDVNVLRVHWSLGMQRLYRMMDVCLQWGGIIIWVYNCLCGRFSSQLKHEPLCTLQNLPGLQIQLHTAGSVGGQQAAFSRKRAGKQLALRVSCHKQTVTVCTRAECYQPAIISRQEFFLPKGLPEHASIRSSNWFRFLSLSWEQRAVKLPKCPSVYRQMFTCVSLSYKASALVPQRRRWPAAHPVLRGSAVPVSSVGVGMCRPGRVHSWRVSRPNGKIMVGFFKQHKYLRISPTPTQRIIFTCQNSTPTKTKP